ARAETERGDHARRVLIALARLAQEPLGAGPVHRLRDAPAHVLGQRRRERGLDGRLLRRLLLRERRAVRRARGERDREQRGELHGATSVLASVSSFACTPRARPSADIAVLQSIVKRALISLSGLSASPCSVRWRNASIPNGPK